MMSRKRKIDDSVEPILAKTPCCILHIPDIDHGEFTSFSDVKGMQPSEKLLYLQGIRDIRLKEPLGSSRRMEHVCALIPNTLDTLDLNSVGYDRACYQRFTNHLDDLGVNPSDNETTAQHSPRKANKGDIYPPECIYCEKLEIKVSKKTERCIKFNVYKNPNGTFREPSWKQIEPRALALGEYKLYRKVKGADLFAHEACFHPYCNTAFKLKYTKHIQRQAKLSNQPDKDPKAAANENAFKVVLDCLEQRVVKNKEIIQLAFLRNLYMQHLQNQGYPNDDFRSEKLKARLEKHDIKEKINFAKINPGDKGCITYNLVFSADITVADAIICAYKLGARQDRYEELALKLRGEVQQTFKETEDLPWPPTADDFNYPVETRLPQELLKFLNVLILGDKEIRTEKEQAHRLLLSITQDICRGITRGEWKLPKHVLLCTTLRHLYRCKLLICILNRLGHCENYDFALEMECSEEKALDESSSYLTPQIIVGDGNQVVHFEWDNLNKFTTSLLGCNIVNSTAGIIIQEIKPEVDLINRERTLPLYERTKRTSSEQIVPEILPPFQIGKRIGPKFPNDAVFTPPEANEAQHRSSMHEYHIWMMTRFFQSIEQKQIVPGFGGFVSATGIKPLRKSTIDYLTPIHQPFTEYASIKELLRRSEEATTEVGQDYVLTTFDLGGCMKALPMIWKYPERYDRHVVTIGPFHTAMNYLGVVTGHKCAGSGYAEILIEADLVSGGCLPAILKGKVYAKALFCLKTVCEAMERLLFEQFLKEEDIEGSIKQKLLDLAIRPSRGELNDLLADEEMLSVLTRHQGFEVKVRQGYLGKTAQFWMSIIDHTHLILMLQYAVKTNNLELFHKCNGDMAELFFAYDHQNYSRYLVWLEVYLTNIEKTHPGATELLQKGGIAVARSLLPSTLSAVDKTMEETFMRFSKSEAGFIGLFSKFGAYQRWCRTTSVRTQLYEKSLEMCGLIDDPESPKYGKHREMERSEIAKSEDAVQKAIIAVKSFTNPFTINDRDHLFNLASGAPSTLEIEKDVLGAEEVGRKIKEEFIKKRFMEGSSEDEFFEPIKRRRLKTMDVSNKVVKLTTSQGKIIRYQEQRDLAFTLLVKSQQMPDPISLPNLMKYSLSPIPHSIGTADGFLYKTNKAALLQAFVQDMPDEEITYPVGAIFIQDGNALFHTLTNMPPTLGEVCLQILDIMVPKKSFIFSTDCYHPGSIKFMERLRRGIAPDYIIDGPATRRPNDFGLFLSPENNKTKFSRLLLNVWSSKVSATRLQKTEKAIAVIDGKAYRLQSSSGTVTVEEVCELISNQEETDTRVIPYLDYAARQGYKAAVVRSPDTDVFFILLHHAALIALTIYGDIGKGTNRKLYNITDLASAKGPEYCKTILGLHVFTGEDTTSAFKGRGKATPLKKLTKYPKYEETFRTLGENWTVPEHVVKQLEEFTCIMYGYPRQDSVNMVRSIMLKKMVGDKEELTSDSPVDLEKLPPCRDSLILHIRRANYRLAQHKRAKDPIFWSPKPNDGHGWVLNENSNLELQWSAEPFLPQSLIDIAEATQEEIRDQDDFD